MARGYCNLEFDLDDGERGRRTDGVARLLRRLTGAEAATVVNNNAAATVLALRALAAGREVVVSRGQLVEIGGSFRLPEIFEVSGARLREVGTTNKTRLVGLRAGDRPGDRRPAPGPPEQLTGSSASPRRSPSPTWPRSARRAASGRSTTSARAPSARVGRPHVAGEPTVAEGLAAGADLVLFSGDKLLGGPQCGPDRRHARPPSPASRPTR